MIPKLWSKYCKISQKYPRNGGQHSIKPICNHILQKKRSIKTKNIRKKIAKVERD